MGDMPRPSAAHGSSEQITPGNVDNNQTVIGVDDIATISEAHEDHDMKMGLTAALTEPRTDASLASTSLLDAGAMATHTDDKKPASNAVVLYEGPFLLPAPPASSGNGVSDPVENVPAPQQEKVENNQAEAGDSDQPQNTQGDSEQMPEMFADIDYGTLDVGSMDIDPKHLNEMFRQAIGNDEQAQATVTHEILPPFLPETTDAKVNSFDKMLPCPEPRLPSILDANTSLTACPLVTDAPANNGQDQAAQAGSSSSGKVPVDASEAAKVVHKGAPVQTSDTADVNTTTSKEVDSLLNEVLAQDKDAGAEATAVDATAAADELAETAMEVDGPDGFAPAVPLPPQLSPEEAVRTTLAQALLSPEPHTRHDQVRPDATVAANSDENAIPSVEAIDVDDALFVDAHPDDSDPYGLLNLQPVENQPLLADAAPPGYAWHDADKMPEEQAIRVLEEAVQTAIQFGRKAVEILAGPAASGDSRLNVSWWTDEFRAICAEQDNFRVLVGVSGATGAGKTTLINALLDTYELLPSGSDSAATATVCKVHKSEDGSQGPAFRAVVSYKTEEDMRTWLSPILDDVQAYYAWFGEQLAKDERRQKRWAEEYHDEEEDEEEDEAEGDGNDDFVASDQGTRQSARIKEKEAAQSKKTPRAQKQPVYEEEEDEDPFDITTLREKLNCVESVFGLDLEDLRGVKVERLLDRKKFPIMRCVGKTKTIVGDNKDKFAATVRPFLDSTRIDEDFNYDDYDQNGEEESDEEEEEEEGDEEGDEEEEEEGEDEKEDVEDGDEVQAKNVLDLEPNVLEREPAKPTVLWPLVAQVNIYLRDAPLLANGIVLADVPGLADALEERARVANDCFETLDITMIVAPAIRAVDDATCHQLLSANEEMYLRLNNRLARRNFCVVSSKTDDLDWEPYLKREVRPIPDSRLERHLQRHCQAYTMLQEARADERTKQRNVKAYLMELRCEREIAGLLEELAEGVHPKIEELENKTLPGIDSRMQQLSAGISFYRGLLAFHATAWRNAKIQRNMQANFQRRAETVWLQTARQRAEAVALAAATGSNSDITPPMPAGDPIDVIPASATAYWTLKKHAINDYNDTELVVGYPEYAFTGIPAIRAWIRSATIPMRQRHALSLLRRLMVLLVQLKTGYGDAAEREPSASPVPGEPDAPPAPKPSRPAPYVSDNPAEDVHKLRESFQAVLSSNLGRCIDTLVERVQRCNPMMVEDAAGNMVNVWKQEAVDDEGNKRRLNFKAKCRAAVIELVETWQFRTMDKTVGASGRGGGRRGGPGPAPANMTTCFIKDIKGNNAKVAWTTHAAIIRRHGGIYVSKGRIPGRYEWMRSMASLVLADIVQHWQESMHGDLPRETAAARGLLEDAWDRALVRLRALLPAYFPVADHGFLGEQLLALHAVRERMVDGAQRAMEDVAQQGKTVLSSVEAVLLRGWQPQFERAAQQSGKGVFRTRQGMLEAHARDVTTPLVKSALKVLDQQFAYNLEELTTTLGKILDDGHQQIVQQLDAIVRRVGGENNNSNAYTNGPVGAFDARARRINALLHQWEGDWKAPDAYTHVAADDAAAAALPHKYIAPPPELALETLLPNFGDTAADDAAEDALADELATAIQPKTRKRPTADNAAGDKPAAKKRKAAPKKTKEPGAGPCRGGKAGAARGGRGGKGSRGGRGGRGRGK